MKKNIWSFSIALGLFSALVTGIVATALFAISLFIEHETAWDIVGGIGWSICFIGQMCAIIELSKKSVTVIE